MGARQFAWLGVASLVASGCLLDDNHCGANQVEVKDLFEGCICGPNAVPNADGIGCRLCGANEQVIGGACTCVAGYSRTSPTAACMQPAEGGVVADGGAPADGGAVADAGPPSGTTGQGAACSSQADCASFDATYCQMLQAPNQCFVQGCATGERACASDHECCDFTGFPLLEPTHGLCVETGKCSTPGKVVKP